MFLYLFIFFRLLSYASSGSRVPYVFDTSTKVERLFLLTEVQMKNLQSENGAPIIVSEQQLNKFNEAAYFKDIAWMRDLYNLLPHHEKQRCSNAVKFFCTSPDVSFEYCEKKGYTLSTFEKAKEDIKKTFKTSFESFQNLLQESQGRDHAQRIIKRRLVPGTNNPQIYISGNNDPVKRSLCNTIFILFKGIAFAVVCYLIKYYVSKTQSNL